VLAFLSAAFILMMELRRKEAEGLLESRIIEEIKGKPASPFEIISNAVILRWSPQLVVCLVRKYLPCWRTLTWFLTEV